MENKEQTGTAATQQPEKQTKAARTAKQAAGSVLEKTGLTAIKEHGYAQVFVTDDGMVFPLEGDAKNHAANLKNRTILNVKKK